MKKTILLLLTIVLNINFSFSQTELTNDILQKGKNVEIRIKSNKKIYHIGDVIQIKIVFNSKMNDDLLKAEATNKNDLLTVFKELGYEL